MVARLQPVAFWIVDQLVLAASMLAPTVSLLPHCNENFRYAGHRADTPNRSAQPAIAGCSFSGLAVSEAWFIALALTGLVGFLATVAWMLAGG